MTITLDDLRQFTVRRNFFKPTTLRRALYRMGFVQADPIRAPARAQDLILRHRVRNYHAGDLERRYEMLDIDEDVFVNYGFVTSDLRALMHPRSDSRVESVGVGAGRDENGKAEIRKTRLVLDFIRDRGAVHPREVDEHFSHGTVTNYWGGSSNATTHRLDAMHYHGLLRVARREKGIRIYTIHQHEQAPTDPVERGARIDALADVVVGIYAPLPGSSLTYYLRRLRYAAPQWQGELTSALQRAKQRLSHVRVDGVEWYWPAGEQLSGRRVRLSRVTSDTQDTVRLLAPFDPVVHDRARFQLLWGWVYRFEAYTPVPKRKLGYYAMPLLWRDRVIGWGNLSVLNGKLKAEFGYIGGQPRARVFKRELEAELDRVRAFLRLESSV
jgi:hypothetical protein